MKYQIMLYTGLLGSIVMLVVTIILFVRCNVMEVAKDITGIRIGKQSTEKKNKVKFTNKKDLTDSTGVKEKHKKTVDNTGKSINRTNDMVNAFIEEGVKYDEETSIIDEVADEETIILEYEQEETSLLYDDGEETSLLNGVETTILSEEILGENDYVKEIDIMVIHCNSII